MFIVAVKVRNSALFCSCLMLAGHSYVGLRYEEGNCGVSVMRSGWFTS